MKLVYFFVGGTPGTFTCEDCGRKYKYKYNLNQHKRNECGMEPRFPCIYCEFRSYGIKPFSCDECGRSYKYRRNLVQHKRIECGKEASLCCPICPYKTNVKSNLKAHYATRHSEQLVGKIISDKHFSF
ncbi:zinc finger protein 875-like [Macrosteles quadrilineatus]|uniref:zinc finger protein 875-like n=1 Tax=Macrosteles quadrilineatus TaxID=74068 RepID=UPI0023E31DBD|nr:zinc finger protein 875-like [Macrosteles quadrilineatus]